MREFISNNPSLFGGIILAFLSLLSSIINFFKDRKVEEKKTKKMQEYVEIYNILPDNLKAKKTLEKIIEQLAENILTQHSQKINLANIIATIFLAVVCGGISYLLAMWASHSTGFWSVLLWILFSFSALFTVLVPFAGIANRNKKASSQSSDSK